MPTITSAKNPLKQDPTRTTLLRKQFIVELRKRIRELRKKVRALIVEEDAFGLQPRPNPFALNMRFAFETTDAKVKGFNKWFKQQVDSGVLGIEGGEDPETPWTAKYTTSAYKKGVVRSFIETKKAGLKVPTPFLERTKEDFLRSSFAGPVATAQVKTLATRSFEQLKGVSQAMSATMSRELAAGFSEGRSAEEIARRLDNSLVKIERTRARTIARTEVIHSYAEGQLDSYEELDVKEVGVMAEWVTAGDDRVCPECAALEGVVMKIKEARSLIPRHPNCRCAWLPANVGEKKEAQQKIRKERIEASIRKSLKAERPNLPLKQIKEQTTWPGADRKIAKVRVPKRVQRKIGKRIGGRISSKQAIKNRQKQLAKNRVGKRKPVVVCDGLIQNIDTQFYRPAALILLKRPKCKPIELPAKGKAAKAKRSHKPATAEKQRFAEANEPRIAKKIGGKALPDNEPEDILLEDGELEHGIELKTMVDNKNSKITMHPDSRKRKLKWQRQKKGRRLHTVVSDRRNVFMGGVNTSQFSGNELYYRRGVGSFTLNSMIPMKDAAELKKFIKATSRELKVLVAEKKAAAKAAKEAAKVTFAPIITPPGVPDFVDITRTSLVRRLTRDGFAEDDIRAALKAINASDGFSRKALRREILKGNEGIGKIAHLGKERKEYLQQFKGKGLGPSKKRRKAVSKTTKKKTRKVPSQPGFTTKSKIKGSIEKVLAEDPELQNVLDDALAAIRSPELEVERKAIDKELKAKKTELDFINDKYEQDATAYQEAAILPDGTFPPDFKPYWDTEEGKETNLQWNAINNQLGEIRDKQDELVGKTRDKLIDELSLPKELQADKPKITFRPITKTVHVSDGTDVVTADSIGDDYKGRLNEALDFLQKMTAKRPGVSPSDIQAWRIGLSDRPFQAGILDPDEGIYLTFDSPVSTFVHEIVHRIETDIPGGVDKAKEFIKYRIAKAGTSDVKLRDLFSSYGSDEIGNKDGFLPLWPKGSKAFYATKTYPNNTEVLTMGVELLFDDPVRLATKDPEYFKFIIGMLRGIL